MTDKMLTLVSVVSETFSKTKTKDTIETHKTKREDIKEKNKTQRTKDREKNKTERTEIIEKENTKRTDTIETHTTKRTKNDNMHDTIQRGMEKVADIKKEKIQKNKEIESKKIDCELKKYEADKNEKALTIEKQVELEALEKNYQATIQKQLIEHEIHKEFLKTMQLLVADNIQNNNDDLIKKIEEFQNKKDFVLENKYKQIDKIKDNIYQEKNNLSIFERKGKKLESKLSELIGKYKLRNQDYLEKKKEIGLLKSKKLTQDVKIEKRNLLNLEQEIEDIEYEILINRLEQKKIEKTITGINKILENLKIIEEKEKLEYEQIKYILSIKAKEIIEIDKQNIFQLLNNNKEKIEKLSLIPQIQENYLLPLKNTKNII